MQSMLVLTLAKILDYSKQDVEFMLPGIMERYGGGNRYHFDQTVDMTIRDYFEDVGEAAACRLYYDNMYHAISILLAHGIDYPMLQQLMAANSVVQAKITSNGDVFITLHRRTP